jgi:ferredoxin-NADP reductase
METDVRVASVETVGPDTVAVELETPEGFDAHPGQFVKLSTELDGDVENAFYTISSPYMTDTFEITVVADEDADLGQWLAARDPGEDVDMFGPLGDTHYEGESSVVCLAGGPGIGPCLAVAERVVQNGGDVSLLYQDDEPVHEDRLEALEEAGATVRVTNLDTPLADVTGDALEGDAQVFVYGFDDFVGEARDLLEATGREPDDAKVENFG